MVDAARALQVQHVSWRAGRQAPTLLILLPGAYDQPQDFITHGFPATVHARGAAVDFRLVESDLTSVADSTLAHRLHTQVVAPARTEGYQRIVLGGISIGGLTALVHADHYPGSVDGLVLLAPYPGNRGITHEIARSGGLARWQAGELATTDDEKRGWRALQGLAHSAPAALWLGYGENDRFAPGLAMMADVLPPPRVRTVAGGHDWVAWSALWQHYCTAGELA
jgi:pimeloyl-ACP methyl ester carboxylesterase